MTASSIASLIWRFNGHISAEHLERLNRCYLYLLGKRPRLSIVPETVQATNTSVHLKVEYKLDGATYQSSLEIPRDLFQPEECTFESAYPHRELITRNASGQIVASTILSNFVHFMTALHERARDLEVVYIGKGLHDSAQDRLKSHSTLQSILADLNSNQPDSELFVLVYAFEYHKPVLSFASGFAIEITGDAVERREERATAYHPSLEQQVSLIEATCISGFRPTYNTHYLDFPRREQQTLAAVYEADFAAIAVQLDNTNIGGLRTYSSNVKPESTHYIVVDFRHLEGRPSPFDAVSDKILRRTDAH